MTKELAELKKLCEVQAMVLNAKDELYHRMDSLIRELNAENRVLRQLLAEKMAENGPEIVSDEV